MIGRGCTYDPVVDGPRLRNNFQRVVALLLDGKWHEPDEIRSVGGSEGLKRVRELRDPTFGHVVVYATPVDQQRGLWRYRLDLSSLDEDMIRRIMVEGLRPPIRKNKPKAIWTTCPRCGYGYEFEPPIPPDENDEEDPLDIFK